MDSTETLCPVNNTGFTCLYESGHPEADIIFVHGIQGHPRRTWTSKPVRSPIRLGFRERLGWKRSTNFTEQAKSTTSHNLEAKKLEAAVEAVFWPRDLLPFECKSTRILTWGYDSNVSRFFGGAADKGNIFDHAKNLLYSLNRIRRECVNRPIIFVAHSLGGIIVKETLRRSYGDEDPELQNIANCTSGILFLGTPHRGSSCAPYGEMLRRIVSAVGFDTNDSNIRALHFDSLELQLSQEEFLKIWRKKGFTVRTFQESSGVAGVRGLMEKIVPDISSSFGDTRERAQHLPGNHMGMCRFNSRTDPGYLQVVGELSDILGKLTLQQQLSEPEALSVVYTSRRNETNEVILQSKCRQMLESLQFPQMDDRQRLISEPCHGTGIWLLQTAEYTEWLQGAHKFLWLKGKAGSGKSTLMKRVLQDLQSRYHSETHTIAAYFFDGGGSELQRSTLGFFKTVLYRIFTQNTRLLEEFVSASENGKFSKGKNLEWRLEELMEVTRTLTKLKHWKPTILLLDALDEGSRDDVRNLLHFFEQLFPHEIATSAVSFRVCLASRHYPNITLKDCPELWAERHNTADIEEFTRQKLSYIVNTFDNRRLVDAILQQAEGVFLWVDLVTTAMWINDDDGESFASKMNSLAKSPNGVDALYTQIFTKLSEDERVQTFHILKWVWYASRRLTPVELCLAVQFESGKQMATLTSWKQSDHLIERGEQMEKFIRSRSRGLLEVRPISDQDSASPAYEVVQFIHQTVPEFLQRVGFALLQPSNLASSHDGNCHHQIAKTCLFYLSHRDVRRCAPMTLLRYEADKAGVPFLQSMTPKVTAEEAEIAQHTVELSCAWEDQKTSTALKQAMAVRGMSLITDIVFSELPLLKYAITSLQNHLRRAEEARIFQSSIVDLAFGGNTWWHYIWYSFQNAFFLPRRHRFHQVNWADFLQACVALGLGSCIHEVRNRVLDATYQLPPAWNFWSLEKALDIAVTFGLREIARDLIACGVNLEARDTAELSFLDNACIRGDVPMVKMFVLSGAAVRAENLFGMTPLHHAAKRGVVDLLHILFDAGADIEKRTRQGETPLHLALMADDPPDASIVDILVRRGASVHTQNDIGMTPLHYAARRGVVDRLRVLLDAGAEIEKRNNRKQTPLHLAAAADNLEAVRFLISHGADRDATDAAGQNASRVAEINFSRKVYAFFNPGSPEIPGMVQEGSKDIIPRSMTASPSPEQMRQREGAFALSLERIRLESIMGIN
ncbi:NACHT domain-containing protein [Cladophialophora immunda]|nr:NACHT domain-containing protein [Cladophialophora immunda]